MYLVFFFSLMVHGTPPSWSILGRRREIPLPGINFLPYFGNLWETLEFQTLVVSYRNSLLEKVRDIFHFPECSLLSPAIFGIQLSRDGISWKSGLSEMYY